MIRFARWLPLLVAVLIIPACGGPKKAADNAINEAELTYGQIAEQARNVAPDQAQAIEAGLAAAKASLASGDAKGALATAHEQGEKIKTLTEQLPGLQAKLQDDWNTLNTTVPGALAALRKKLDDFGRPPANMPGRAQYDSTTAQLSPLSQKWDEARSLFVSGKLAEAVSMAQEVQNEAVKLVAGLQVGSHRHGLRQ